MKVAIREEGFDGNVDVFPIELVLRRARDLGYDGVELSSSFHRAPGQGWPSRGVWPEAMSREDREKLRKTAQSIGIEIPTISSDWGPGYFVYDPTLEHWERAVELYRKDMELAADLGAQLIMVYFGSVHPTWEQAKLVFSKIVEEAEKLRIKVGFEASFWRRTGDLGDLPEFMQMVREIDSDYFGAYEHSYYPRTPMQPHEEIEIVGDKMFCLHSSAIDTANVDYEKMFHALKRKTYDWYWVFEVRGAEVVRSRLLFDELMARYW